MLLKYFDGLQNLASNNCPHSFKMYVQASYVGTIYVKMLLP